VPPLIVTGMSRSGTSALARLLQSAGLDVGDRLIPPNENNELGFYEDRDFHALNKELIEAGLAAEPHVRPRWMYADRLDPALLDPFRSRAREMVESRAAGARPWGFKDPRTAALLDFWDEAAPGARFLFVYRPPWDVVDSMFRLSRRPLGGRAELAVSAWLAYNRAILDFAARHRDRCALVHSAAVVAAPEAVVEQANRLLGDASAPRLGSPARDAVDPALLTALAETSSLAEVLRAGFPDVVSVYAELEQEADLPSSALVPTAADPNGGAPPVPTSGGGELPIGLILVDAEGREPGIAREEVALPATPSAGAAANAALAATRSEVVAVAFGACPSAEALSQAAAIVDERRGRAALIGSWTLDVPHHEVLHPRDLLQGAFDPQSVVLRRTMWQAIGGFDESVPAGGLDGWATAVALAASGVPLVPVAGQGGGRGTAGGTGRALPEAHGRAWRHVAARHSELFARQFADVREQFEMQVRDLEAQSDRALAVRDEAEATARDAQVRAEDAEGRAARGAALAQEGWERADEAQRRADDALRRMEEAVRHAEEAAHRAKQAERRAAEAIAERESAANEVRELRATRAHRVAAAWWRAKGRLTRRR
jgi:hypothetical protein